MLTQSPQTDPLTSVLLQQKMKAPAQLDGTTTDDTSTPDNPLPGTTVGQLNGNPVYTGAPPSTQGPPIGTVVGQLNGETTSVGDPTINKTGTAPAPTPTPAQYPIGSGQNVNLAGWDNTRTDNDPKQVFGQFAQAWIASGKPWGADAVRAFVQQDPRWEIDPLSSQYDPHIRVKQSVLDTWKPGTSIYQDTVGDAGPGGANTPQFLNVTGNPSQGYAAPSSSSASSGGISAPNFNPLAPSAPAGTPNTLQALIQSMMGQQGQTTQSQAPSIQDLILSILQQGHQ